MGDCLLAVTTASGALVVSHHQRAGSCWGVSDEGDVTQPVTAFDMGDVGDDARVLQHQRKPDGTRQISTP